MSEKHYVDVCQPYTPYWEEKQSIYENMRERYHRLEAQQAKLIEAQLRGVLPPPPDVYVGGAEAGGTTLPSPAGLSVSKPRLNKKLLLLEG